MPGPDYCRVTTGRASAILTTSEVAGNTCDTKNAFAGQFTLDLSITKGSLTSITIRLYASADNGTTWRIITDGSGNECEHVYTANTSTHISVPPIPGCQKFRATAQGAGTATGSLCAFDYRYLRRGSQS